MKIFILVIIMFIMTSVVNAQNAVYINQSGSGLDLDITLDGDGSSVGTSSDITALTGNNLDIDLDFIGASNTLVGDYIAAGDGDAATDELKLAITGASNTLTMNVGAGNSLTSPSIIETRTGGSGTSDYIVGSASSSGHYADIDIVLTGNTIDLDVTENSTASGSNAKITNINMDTSSNDVDLIVSHSGSGNHDTILDINGSFAGSDITVGQSGNTDSTVSMTFDGATSSDVDVTITP